jgi:ADP-heptose:LPS heptosyltransferase
LRKYPREYQLSSFDMKRYDKLKNSIKFVEHKGRVLIKTSDKNAFKQLEKLDFTRLQAENKYTQERTYCVTDYLHPDYLAIKREISNTDCIKVGIYRTKGGWGDVQMVLSAIWNFKKQFPKSYVIFSCPNELLPLAYNNPTIDQVLDLHEFGNEDFDVLLDLTTPCAMYEVNKQPYVDKNRIEIFAKKCKIDSYDGGKLILTDGELKFANKFITENSLQNKRIIGVIPNSNAPVRGWDKFPGLIKALNDKYENLHFLIFSGENIAFERPPNSHTFVKEPIRNVLALLNVCDVVVGPDTGPMHSAAVLGIPTVWIFTHIDGKIRTQNYKKAKVVQKKVNCISYEKDDRPCWYTVHKKCGVADNYPQCSREITVEDVLVPVGRKLPKDDNVTHIKKHNKPKIMFRQDGTAGDILLTTATIEGLAKKFPDYIIDYMTLGQYSDILGENPYIHEVQESGDWYSGYDEVFVPHSKILNATWNIGDTHLRSLYAKVCDVEEGKVLIIPQDYPVPFKKYVVVHTTSLPQKTYKKFDEAR